MATEFEKGFRDIFLAGVGAMAITGEKAKEVAGCSCHVLFI